MVLSDYNKLWGAIAGNVVGILFAWLVTKGFATCDAANVCSVYGFSQAQITAALMAIINSFFVWRSAKNTNTP